MTATTAPTSVATEARPSVVPIWRTGAVAGLVAAGATTAVAAVAQALDVGLEIDGEAIPVFGFGQVTAVFVLIGLVLATVLARRARHPQATFTRATVVLTAVSCIPSILSGDGTATQLTLVLTHLVAAAIVIPTVRPRLPR